MVCARTLLAIALLVTVPATAAQQGAPLAREVVREVNGRLVQLEHVAFEAQRPDVELESRIRAWRDASGVREIEAPDPDDSGRVEPTSRSPAGRARSREGAQARLRAPALAVCKAKPCNSACAPRPAGFFG
jgi:hypothetical protein